MRATIVAAVIVVSLGCSSSDSGGGGTDGGNDAGGGDATNDSSMQHDGAADTATDGGSDALADSSTPSDGTSDATSDGTSDGGPSHRGFPVGAPWVSFYGNASQMGDLAKAASTFRILNIDADPGAADFDASQIKTLQNGGKNKVISYFDVGSCENYRTWWSSAPSGFVSCSANTKAWAGAYDGYPDEQWMNVGDADYQHLLVDHVAPLLAATGVDGFFLDNLEIVEHSATDTNGKCDGACSQGGLDLVRMLREKFPDLLIVMQNATSDVTMKGTTGGVSFPTLLDGISHEEVYAPSYDSGAEGELLAWKALGLSPGGQPFWIGTEDYVGSCTATTPAKSAYDKSRANGFSPYATDASGSQIVVCYWPF
jgi:cysteinyl-tRNA synthetase